MLKDLVQLVLLDEQDFTGYVCVACIVSKSFVITALLRWLDEAVSIAEVASFLVGREGYIESLLSVIDETIRQRDHRSHVHKQSEATIA